MELELQKMELKLQKMELEPRFWLNRHQTCEFMNQLKPCNHDTG